MIDRLEHRQEVIEALTDAQKIAFAPLSFQAVAALLELGILKLIDEKPESPFVIKEELNLSEYTVKTLLEVAEILGLVISDEEIYSITELGKMFLYDDMTIANFKFVKDVCYKGAEKLTDSFLKGEAEGLKLMYPEAKTIYPYLSKLPENMKNSWFEFDHYYSNNCFDIIYKIITPVSKIFDIGANTGNFEKVCRKYDKDIELNLIDLEENIKVIKNEPSLEGCKFHAVDILDRNSKLPKISGAVIMSQFLDCFSAEQIISILKRVKEIAEDSTKIYILEPFIDRQKYAGAKFSLVHTSLYFTCMANGCSKMYSFKDMSLFIKEAGLRINAVYDALGAHDYTLLECVKNDG